MSVRKDKSEDIANSRYKKGVVGHGEKKQLGFWDMF